MQYYCLLILLSLLLVMEGKAQACRTEPFVVCEEKSQRRKLYIQKVIERIKLEENTRKSKKNTRKKCPKEKLKVRKKRSPLTLDQSPS